MIYTFHERIHSLDLVPRYVYVPAKFGYDGRKIAPGRAVTCLSGQND